MRMWRTDILAGLLLGGVFITACSGPSGASQAYKPLPKWEEKFFAQARKDVFPNDVREAPERYKNTLVAWTGVIKKVEHFTDGSSRVARLTADHHYFDWIENNSTQRERFYMSPRGEGPFAVIWRAETADDEKFLAQFTGGDMLVAYGYPSSIQNNVVGLFPSENIRPIKPQWYRTDILEYGRPGEPSKVIQQSR
jgi:hypothetical protein